MKRKRIHGIVTGRVQGVGFRYFTQENAILRQITGWVRNRRDGSVEFEMQGATGDVDALLRILHQGPPFGHVDDLVSSDVPLLDSEASFTIR